MTTIVSWNINGQTNNRLWGQLLAMDADVALLQEVRRIPSVAANVEASPYAPWNPHLYDRWSKVVKLSNRVDVQWFRQVDPISEVGEEDMAVSGIGLTEAARITPAHGHPFIVVSLYGRWMRAHPSTNSKWSVGAPDISVHRAISDLSAFIGNTNPATHRILVAGDLNIIHGFIDDSPQSFVARDRTIIDRMDALGMVFVGPQHPNGRRASPTPYGLPPDTRNVPTYRTTRQTPATAKYQLDYVFASRGFHESVTARALNGVDEWGPSDHCRIRIQVADT